ncbi:MAG: aminoacyl-tRNA hydrolase [Eubacteriales bacterium]|nr:aminoacyl-tRNA hydrolase [Eubacteriales bacterium]
MQKRRLFGSAGFRKKPAANLKSDYYIIGLGNPGSQYEHTRHNAGFDVVSILAGRHKISTRMHMYKARLGRGIIEGKKVLLAMPQTYMNNSGESLREMAHALGIGADKLIVIYDDIDLKEGVVRIKAKGSAGTHNGMKSVIYHLQTDEFVRVRVGIGKPQGEITDHVLGEYADKQAAFEALKMAADAVEAIIGQGVYEAQNRFN